MTGSREGGGGGAPIKWLTLTFRCKNVKMEDGSKEEIEKLEYLKRKGHELWYPDSPCHMHRNMVLGFMVLNFL